MPNPTNENNTVNTGGNQPQETSGANQLILDRVDEVVAKYNLVDLYWAEKKEKNQEDNRKELFEQECKGKLVDLYSKKFKDLGSFEAIKRDGLDERVFDAFLARNNSRLREYRQEKLVEDVEKRFRGERPKLMDAVKARYDSDERFRQQNYSASVGSTAFGANQTLNPLANDPRYSEQRIIRDNMARIRDEKAVCQHNFDFVLESGESLGGASYKELDLVEENIGKGRSLWNPLRYAPGGAITKNVLFSAANSLLSNVSYAFSDRDHHYGSVDRRALANWGEYIELKEKEKDLASSYAGNLEFINNKTLEELKRILANTKNSLVTKNLDNYNKSYLQEYANKVEETIKALETTLEAQKKKVDEDIEKRTNSTDFKMQESLDDKHERLKWQILSMILMASPFTQGLLIAGPLFDWLGFLGDILGPVFMHEDGFAAGFAAALENFPIFGDVIRLARISDGMEIFFNETPILNAFTGQGGVIDALTRNEIFVNLVETFNFQYLLLPAAVAGASYLTITEVNDRWGDPTTNTKASRKMIRDEHMKGMKDILESASRDSDQALKKNRQSYNERVTKLNREFFEKGIVSEVLLESIENAKNDPQALDSLFTMFDKIKIFGENKNQNLRQYFSDGADIGDKNKSEGLVSAFLAKANEKDGEFLKRVEVFKSVATFVADAVLTGNDVSYEKLGQDLIRDKELAIKASNNFALRFYREQIKSMPSQVNECVLSSMILNNERGDYKRAHDMINSIDSTIAYARTGIEESSDRFNVPTIPSPSTSPYDHKHIGSVGKTPIMAH